MALWIFVENYHVLVVVSFYLVVLDAMSYLGLAVDIFSSNPALIYVDN